MRKCFWICYTDIVTVPHDGQEILFQSDDYADFEKEFLARGYERKERKTFGGGLMETWERKPKNVEN